MARMHSRKHGSSGSTRPMDSTKPKWVEYDKDEVKKLIEKLTKEGNSDSKIGIILRDQYGIPRVRAMKIRISKVAHEAVNKPAPDDLMSLLRKIVLLYKHLDDNKGDKKAVHGLELLESKVRRLVKYYKRTGKIDEKWTYNRKNAELLVK